MGRKPNRSLCAACFRSLTFALVVECYAHLVLTVVPEMARSVLGRMIFRHFSISLCNTLTRFRGNIRIFSPKSILFLKIRLQIHHEKHGFLHKQKCARIFTLPPTPSFTFTVSPSIFCAGKRKLGGQFSGAVFVGPTSKPIIFWKSASFRATPFQISSPVNV